VIKKIVCLFLIFSNGLTQAAEIRLDPQFVVNQILGEGRDAKEVEYKAQAAYTDYYNNYAAYDWQFDGSSTYEDSRKQILSGGGNLRDKTSIWAATLKKSIPTVVQNIFIKLLQIQI
jgi:hypothetical protein